MRFNSIHLVCIFLTFFTFPALLFSQPRATVYRNPDPAAYGRDLNRSSTQTYNPEDFLHSAYIEIQNPYLIPVIISKTTFRGIKVLSNTDSFIKLSRTGQNKVFISLKENSFNVTARFQLVSAPDNLLDYIKRNYTNSFWQDMVIKAYNNSYVFLIYGGNDLNNDGRFSYKEALVMATLLGDREQPLWGIYNGTAYLENIHYSALSKEFNDPGVYYSYRSSDTKNEKITGFLRSIDSNFDDFPFGMYSTINGAIQFEEDEIPEIQLPEEFLFGQEGDKLDFALAFYDLLMRKGYDTKLLHIHKIPDAIDEQFLVCYKQPETFSWSAVHMLGLYRNVSESIEDIPSFIFKHSLMYSELDVMYILNNGKLPENQKFIESIY